jgi:hypothetical protein
MEPAAKKSTDATTMNLISTINTNWSLRSTGDCLTKALFPKGVSNPQQWGLPILQVLAEISALHVDRSDFRAKLQDAIKARQARNRSTVGKVAYMTITDLRAVLWRYMEEEKHIEADEEAPPPTQAKGKGRATRSKKETVAEEEAPPAKQPKPRGRPRKNPIPVPKTPIRPIGEDEDEDDEEEEEEDSDALLAHGKYQYLERVRPVRVNLNPDASVAAKPLRKKPAPRGKKRARNEDEDELRDPRAAKRPSVIHEDPDPRIPDDTGFLSPLVATPRKEKKERKSNRLSRLQANRIREPHWQQPVVGAVDIPGEVEEVPAENVIVKEAPGPAEDAVFVEVLRNLEDISDSATVEEKLEMEELRLSMERRVWRIKVLRIQQRAGVEKDREIAGQANTKGTGNTDMRRSGRTLRIRKGKK